MEENKENPIEELTPLANSYTEPKDDLAHGIKETIAPWPLWKVILYFILFPFVLIHIMFWAGIAKLGKWIFRLADLMTGKQLNYGQWYEDF